MNKIFAISIMLCFALNTFGQNRKDVNLIEADSTWGKEIIQVPFWFAPKINYTGNEDIRFATGWEKIESPGFWTLVFAWDINLKIKPTEKFFEENLKLYFDGLMKVVNENEELIIPKTKAAFIKGDTKKGMTAYRGTIETYDAFTTKEMITLYVTIESFYCVIGKKYIPIFKFSPQNFKHEVWGKLNRIKLRDNICNN